eukprot:2913573-Pleurochrysis_carterae.AAC.1
MPAYVLCDSGIDGALSIRVREQKQAGKRTKDQRCVEGDESKSTSTLLAGIIVLTDGGEILAAGNLREIAQPGVGSSVELTAAHTRKQ